MLGGTLVMAGQQKLSYPIVMWLFASILHSMTGDALWKTFKYRSRPKCGTFFDRFRSRQKLNDERFLAREFLLLAFVQATKSAYDNLTPLRSERIVARICELLVDGRPSTMAPWMVLDFPSRDHCAKFFHDGLIQYLSVEENGQLPVFVERYRLSCGELNLPKFLVCGAWMFANQLPYLKRSFDEGIRQAVFDDMPVQGQAWVDYISDVTEVYQKRNNASQSTIITNSSAKG